MMKSPPPSIPLRNDRPLLMLVINTTPDSFSDGGLFVDPKASLRQIEQSVAQGADIIDIGGASSRPGSLPIPREEEWQRIAPLLKLLQQEKFTLPISVDTTHAWIAQRAFDLGVTMINDISALSDPAMGPTIASYQGSVVLMHMQGTPGTMQQAPWYHNVTQTVMDFWHQRSQLALEQGIAAQRIWVDPGIGFGKTTSHNLTLLHDLPKLCQQPYPVLLGPSRKGFLGQLTQQPVEQRDRATAAVCTLAAAAGVRGCRIHNIQACKDGVLVGWAIGQDLSWRARLDSNQLPPA